MTTRDDAWTELERCPRVDVLIIGAGVNGASIFDQASRRGYRALLIDRSDFGSGTSQASGLLVWGGLLYLKHLHLKTVWELSRERDRAIASFPDAITPLSVRYVPTAGKGVRMAQVAAGYWLYWALGNGRRRAPRFDRHFAEQALLRPTARGSFVQEEGMLLDSDCRYTLDRIVAAGGPNALALNHVELGPNRRYEQNRWGLSLRDCLTNRVCEFDTTAIVNCAGPWSDAISRDFGARPPFRHELSKGVYLGLRRREGHRDYLVIDQPDGHDVLTLVPWGPLSLWGPTESFVTDPNLGRQIESSDVAWLADHYRATFRRPLTIDEVESVRVGIRPLVLRADQPRPKSPIRIARRQAIHREPNRAFVCCFGGKFTNGRSMARRAMKLLADVAPTGRVAAMGDKSSTPREVVRVGGLEFDVVVPEHARDAEWCCTADDYLRRRTNLAQWLPRPGWSDDRVVADLEHLLARTLPNHAGDARSALEGFRRVQASTFAAVEAAFREGGVS